MAKNPPTVKRSCKWLVQSSVADIEWPQALVPSMNHYLILYNTLSCLGWGYVLVMTCLHLANAPLPKILSPISEVPSPVSLQALAQYICELVGGLVNGTKILLVPPTDTLITAMIPPQLSDIYIRMTTTYGVVGPAVAIVQTAAALEIFHALSGLVKSPLLTAAIQVYSRLFLVWAITGGHEQVRWQLLALNVHSSAHSSVTSQCALLHYDSRLVHHRSDPLCVLRTFACSREGSRFFGLPEIHHLLRSLPDWRLKRGVAHL